VSTGGPPSFKRPRDRRGRARRRRQRRRHRRRRSARGRGLGARWRDGRRGHRLLTSPAPARRTRCRRRGSILWIDQRKGVVRSWVTVIPGPWRCPAA